MKKSEISSVQRNCRIALDNYWRMVMTAKRIHESTAKESSFPVDTGSEKKFNANSDFLLNVSLQGSVVYGAAEVWFRKCVYSAGVVTIEPVGYQQSIIMLPREIDCLPTESKSFHCFDRYKFTFEDNSFLELPFRDPDKI